MIKKGILIVLLLIFAYLALSRVDVFGFRESERSAASVDVNSEPKFILEQLTLTELGLPEPERQHLESNFDSEVRQELLTMLKAGQFSELDARIETEALRYERAEIGEYELSYFFLLTAVIDPSLEPLFEQWVATSGSWAANMATAKYLDRMAWQWRGTRYVQYVSPHSLSKFREAQEKISHYHNAARHDKKRNVIWLADNIEYAKQSGVVSQQGQIDEALLAFPKSESILDAAIDAQSARWGGDSTRQDGLIKRLAILKDGISGNDSATMNLYSSRAAARRGDVTSAISYIKTAIQQKPNRLEYYSTLARYYWSEDKLNEALAILNVLLEYWPQSTSSLRLRADVYADLGELEMARKDIDLLLSYSPYHLEANMVALKIYALQGDKVAAEQGFERASYFRAYDAEHWVRLGIKAEYDFKDKALGKNYYQKALDIDPLQPAAHYSFARFHHKEVNCKIVENLYGYLKGCSSGNPKKKESCIAKQTEWILSYVQFLQKNKMCSEINDYDFQNLSKVKKTKRVMDKGSRLES